MTKVLYPKGMQVTCPDCEHVIATANRDVMKGAAANVEDYDSPYDMAGFAMNCPKCNGKHLRIKGGRMQVHTPEGWV